MKSIILAAGYGTRLAKAAESMEECELKHILMNNPKPLAPINGKPILEHLVKDLESIDSLDEIFIITNDSHYPKYEEWRKRYHSKKRIEIINDGTTSNETRLGAIRDIYSVIQQKNIHEDTVVLCGDNVMSWDIKDFLAYFKQMKHSVTATMDLGSKEAVKRFGVLELGPYNRIIGFEEKPQNPKTTFASVSVYIFRKDDLALVDTYLKKGLNPDAPGFFIQWLSQQTDMYAYIFDQNKGQKWFDIGDLETYKLACRTYK